MEKGGIYIGTSGWSYDHWEGIVYPAGTPTRERLAWYVRRGYRTAEVNNTFYRWPAPSAFEGWRRELPEGFLMAVKASRGLTQFRKLREPEGWLARMEPGLRTLGDRLGPLLVQLPPHLPKNLPRLVEFLQKVPDGVRVAVEFRHPSWDSEEVYTALEAAGAAYSVTSGAGLPCVLRATAPDFVYIRLHGPDPHHLYAGSYSDADLHWWADRIREWQAMGRAVFAYFNNDGFGNAVRNADTLRGILGA